MLLRAHTITDAQTWGRSGGRQVAARHRTDRLCSGCSLGPLRSPAAPMMLFVSGFS